MLHPYHDLEQTLGAARALLSGLPDETPVILLQLDDPEFVFIVDRSGSAQRVLKKTRRSIFLTVDVPVAS